jgi:hypothetical protein
VSSSALNEEEIDASVSFTLNLYYRVGTKWKLLQSSGPVDGTVTLDVTPELARR